MTIRVFTQEDLPQIFEIYSRSKLDELRFEEKTFSLLPLDQDQKRLFALLESDIYVFDDGHCIQGYGAVCGNEIRALFVLVEYRGKAIGKRLLEYLLSKISSEASLNVAQSNYPAIELYSSYGFRVTDTFKTAYNQVPVIAQRMLLAK
ncbi:MAG: GNAT family N-acetyltransferase [Arenicella sp.]